MARPRNSVPKYELHKSSGCARVRWCGKTVWLGKHNTPESLKEYSRVLAEIATAPEVAARKTGATVNELVAAFADHAGRHYRGADGTLTSEHREYARSVVHLLELYGHTPAAEFGPVALQAVRAAMVGAGWCRSVVNKRVGRVRRVFRWGVAQELVPASVVTALECVQGLQKGRCSAPETEPVLPAPIAHVEAALPFLDRHQRAMAELQLLTGMRPGEVCALRLCELERPEGSVWTWRPGSHKTAWKGRTRTILFGPKAQTVISTFLAGCAASPSPSDWLFSPRVAQEERLALRKAARVTPVRPWEKHRTRKANPARTPARKFNVGGYGHALTAACEKAKVPVFSPNMLRHTFATLVRKDYGLEAAQVLLGHANMKTSEIYAEKSLALASRVAGEIG